MLRAPLEDTLEPVVRVDTVINVDELVSQTKPLQQRKATHMVVDHMLLEEQHSRT